MDSVILAGFKILVVLFSVVIHEVSHGLMAYRLGDPTAKNLGRLTLNPLPHLDLFGSILLPLITFYLGGFIFGYAKPVPYNPLLLRDQRYGAAKVGFAGPASNLALALAFGLSLRYLPPSIQAGPMPELFSFIVLLNLVLAVFNLVPIPPLDGHWLLLTFLPDRFYAFKRAFQQYGLIFFFVFIIFFFPFLLPIVQFLFRSIIGGS